MSRTSLLRTRNGRDGGRVTMVELFFDLVFAFATTQLSHRLLAHLDWVGVAQTALLLFGVWWVWIYTSWVTNWLDPERTPVRLCLFALMLGGLVLSASIPEAFAERTLTFIGAYVGMQVGRTLFFLWAVRHESLARRRNFQRILVWLLASGSLWIGGAFLDGGARFVCWAIGLLIEVVGPALYYRVPGLGRSSTADWDVDGGHMAERCAAFVIIALGEALLVTGATFAEAEWNATAIAAFVVAFLGSVAMWWIYFDSGAERASHRIAHSDDPGRIARLAYTYIHVLIIGGIIVCAVADEISLVHPGHAEPAAIAAILGGPALYLIGNALFKWVTNDRRGPPLSHLLGIVLLLVAAPFVHALSALALAAFTTAVLMLVAAWETIALRR
ncbi:MAG TPA: low temperature requirement protein A [Dokdonella sp.]